MRTKYILHGGLAGHTNADNDMFFTEILKDTPTKIKILLVYFAIEMDRISVNKAEDISQFKKNNDRKILEFIVASENNFLRQIELVDVVYFHGGKSAKIINTLKRISNLESLFRGKIVAAESAGVNALTYDCYSSITNLYLKGLGIIPVRSICHYRKGDDAMLPENKFDLDLLLLPEYKFKIFYKEYEEGVLK